MSYANKLCSIIIIWKFKNQKTVLSDKAFNHNSLALKGVLVRCQRIDPLT